MERSADIEHNSAFRPGFLALFGARLYRFFFSGNDDLSRTIIICHLYFADAVDRLLDHPGLKSHNGRHAADARRHLFLHIDPAFSHCLCRVNVIHGIGRHERAVLAQAEARRHIRPYPPLPQHFHRSHARRQQRHLCKFRNVYIFIFLKAERPQIQSNGLARLVKNLFRHGKTVIKLLSHSYFLRSLSRKYKCNLTHTFIFPRFCAV